VLVLGGSRDDLHDLLQLGFRNITLSNLVPADLDTGAGHGIRRLAIDGEDIAVVDSAYDLVFAHEVLHHCRSPHRTLCEMLRVSRRHIAFLEPNDSVLMRLLVKMRFSFPYETTAVVAHDCCAGGLRDSAVPNYIYRWNENEVSKTVSSFLAERTFSVRAYPYWDFNVDERAFARHKLTKLPLITAVTGARNLLLALRFWQGLLNRTPLRRQGNKFFCWIEKHSELKPWLLLEQNQVVFNRGQYG